MSVVCPQVAEEAGAEQASASPQSHDPGDSPWRQDPGETARRHDPEDSPRRHDPEDSPRRHDPMVAGAVLARLIPDVDIAEDPFCCCGLIADAGVLFGGPMCLGCARRWGHDRQLVAVPTALELASVLGDGQRSASSKY